jgi:hypothetical protein
MSTQTWSCGDIIKIGTYAKSDTETKQRLDSAAARNMCMVANK